MPHGSDSPPPAGAAIERLEVSGTPRARGRAHGEHFRAAIVAAIDATAAESLARSRGGADLGLVDRSLVALAKHFPAMAEELAGIAEGARVGTRALAVLNGATAQRVTGPTRALDLIDAGGTSIYCTGPQGPMLGHVLDLPHALAASVFALELAATGPSPGAIVVTIPGVLGLLGLNGGGLAVSSMGLHTGAGLGIPFAAVTRGLLALAAPQAALDTLRRVARARGRYWVATDGRQFVGAEASVEYVVRTQRGAKAAHLHTNHCFDPVLRRVENIPRRSTTFSRINVASTVYAQQRPRTAEALWSMLNAHDDGPLGALCHHPHPDPDANAATDPVTAAIVVVRPMARTLQVVVGCARRGTPRVLSLASP